MHQVLLDLCKLWLLLSLNDPGEHSRIWTQKTSVCLFLLSCLHCIKLSVSLPLGAATSSSSSSPSSSSITAAVMLTLAEPSMSNASQNGMSVECRWQRDLLKHFALNGCWGPRLFYTAQWHKKNQTSTILYLKVVSWQADLALKCTFFMKKKYNELLFLKQ